MNGRNVFGLVAGNFAIIFLVATCGGGGEAEPNLEPTDQLSLTCTLTEIASLGPVRAFRGEDRVPTGFDSINSARCTFNMPISFVSVQLSRQGEVVFEHTVALDPISTDVPFPLPRDLVPVVPADLETGRYDRRMTATSTNGETIEVELDYFQVADVIWVFDPARSPESAAREALAEKLGIAADVPQLIVFEPVDWPDTSLGCPEPGKVYAQVITPGFRLVFEHQR